MERDKFLEILAAQGFGEVVIVTREPGGMLASHVHPFEAMALILEGEIHIASAAADRVYRPGDIFHLQANEAHTERYGMQGVSYLVGRKQ